MAKKWLLRLAPLALLFGALPAQAQNASSITGVVTDGSTGKPVDGAVVVVSNPAAKVEETVVTEGGGKFTVPNLPAGQFKLAVSLDGYKPFERSDLNVKENTTLRANAALSPEGVQLEEVVVTGSRIRRKDLTTPAPVTVLNREAVQTSGKVSVGDFLQSLPEQGNAINTGTNNGGDGSVRISLRSLGSARTLVLVNGRRMVAGGTGADSSVDLNSIPTAAIERIEVLKDGASAVYGSDAIAGVVNIITRKDWSGLDLSLYSGVSSRSDAKINDLAVTLGSADDKGSIIFSAGLYDQTSAMAGDRAFASKQENFDATGQNSGTVGPYPLGSSRVPNGRVSLSLSGGNALYQYLQGKFTPPGKSPSGYLIHDSTITPAQACIDAAAASGIAEDKRVAACQWRKGNFNVMAPEGDLYNFALYNYMLTPSRRYNFYTAGDRKVGDYARVFYEAMYVNRQSKQQLAPEPLIIGPTGVENPDGSLVRINKGNYYNPFGTDVSNASRRLDEFGDRIHEEDVNTYRIVAGVDGTLPDTFGPLKGWAWDTSFNYGRTNATFLLRGSLQSSRIAAALGPSRMENGQLVCVGTDGKVVPGCVPLNLFGGAGTITKDQVDYLSFNGTSKGYNELAAFQVNASGDLVKLFGERAAGLAVGFEHRYVAGGFTNDPLTAKNDTSNGGSKDTDGHYSVNEGYGELSLPVVANRPGFEELELTGALRVFDYTNFGSGSTYKLGARWSPIRDVTVRGTYSTAFRAPTISELYSGQGADFPSVSDPCGTITDPDVRARCIEIGGIAPTGQAGGNGDDNSQEKSVVGGNPDLKPETAKIYTLGLVYQPRQVPGLSLTVDYYNIAIKKSISSIGASTIIAGCMAGNDAYCALVGRDPQSHQILQITDLNQNVGEEATSGIDFTGRYDLKTARAGRFGFDGVVTWLRKHDQTLADGSVVRGKGTFDLQANSGAGGSNPEWKGNLAVNWGLGDLGAGVAMKYIGSFKECGDPGGNFGGSGLCYVDDQYSRPVKAYTAWDLYVSYRLGSFAGKTTIMAGINNVFDKAPPRIYNGFANNTDTYAYDQIGRYYYIRLAHSL